MIPPLDMVAIASLLLVQVPLIAGVALEVAPTHILVGPLTTTIGLGLIVTGADGNETQPSVDLNVKVTDPSATPVTTPPLVTVAIDGLLLVHVPPELGESVVVAPIQIPVGPVILTDGRGMIARLMIGSEAQPNAEV